jgi:hypothetical protein
MDNLLKRKITRGGFFVLICLSFLLLLPKVFAQSATSQQSLTLSPTSNIQSFDKGASSDGTVQIINQGSAAYDFTVYSTPYSVSGEDYQQDFSPVAGAINIASWFNFPSTTYHINPGQTVAVPYTINVPSAVLSGGYYGVIFAEIQNPQVVNGVTIKDRLGSIFYLTVNGPAVNQGSLLSWDAKPFQKPNLTGYVRIANTGTLHFSASVNATVKDIFGFTKLNFSSAKEVLPQTVRRIPIEWKNTPFMGLYKINGSVTYLGKTNILGTKYVIVMSQLARYVIGGVAILLVVILIIHEIAKHRRNKKKKKHGPNKKKKK